MARLEVVHSTRFEYDRPIVETVMEIRARPLDGLGQSCDGFALEVAPVAAVHSYRDGFGNHVHYFNHLAAHEAVEVRARSVVTTGAAHEEAPAGLDFPEDFLGFRHPVLDVAGVRRLAKGLSADEDGLDALALRINRQFEYVPLTTDVYTAVDRVLALRSGVCQDFAHLFVAAARSLGVPCRYVSGYIHPGSGHVGAGATHAWAEGHVGGRWIGYDPTNPVRAGQWHVRVAVGRDYRDVPPTRGVYKGGGHESMTVNVEVRSLP